MVLNIFPRHKDPPEAVPAPQPEPLPEPSPEALQDPPKRTRRGTRGGRGRSRASEKATVTEAADIETTEAADVPGPEAVAEEVPTEQPAPSRRRSRKPTAVAAEAPATEAEVAAEETEGEPRPSRGRNRQVRTAPETQPAPDTTAAILKALEQQNRQLEQLLRTQEELLKKLTAQQQQQVPPPETRPTQLPRVGVFVDAANIELACDRLRARFDWGKVLALLTKDRQLVRALAYSPVHDDPAVSMETQRFAEPFLDKGFKIVTKPLKRFSDGSIKANTDIEMALDVVSMLERLDIVCIVSGDGDFQPLVEYVQRRGVRCEVAAIGSSTASNLRNAADAYIDLQQRLKEIKA